MPDQADGFPPHGLALKLPMPKLNRLQSLASAENSATGTPDLAQHNPRQALVGTPSAERPRQQVYLAAGSGFTNLASSTGTFC